MLFGGHYARQIRATLAVALGAFTLYRLVNGADFNHLLLPAAGAAALAILAVVGKGSSDGEEDE
ncbi:MAG: hypothetical protein ACR2MY_01450 [Candidatus Dormibacteria bacterium]